MKPGWYDLADWHGGPRRMEWERRAGRMKLTPDIVRAVRKMTRAEMTKYAEEIGVAFGTLQKVRLRRAWTWVED